MGGRLARRCHWKIGRLLQRSYERRSRRRLLWWAVFAPIASLSRPPLQTTCRDWDRCLSARNGSHLSLQACLRLKNIGGAKVRLQWERTRVQEIATWRVQISHMAKEQEDAPAEMRWRHYRVFDT
jgi:hypothetical protein